MMNYIILGLLSKKDLTVYDIKIMMDKSINKFYSNSFGSINPAIKKLEQQNLITCTEVIEKTRLKKRYKITLQGKISYQEWLLTPIKQGRIKDEILVKIFFLNDLPKKEQENIITSYLEELNTSKIDLENTKAKIEDLELSDDSKHQIKFQMSTLQFGIDYMDFKQKWFLNLLKNL